MQWDGMSKDAVTWNINPSWEFACSIAVEVLRNPDADPEAVADCRDVIQRAAELAESYRQLAEAGIVAKYGTGIVVE